MVSGGSCLQLIEPGRLSVFFWTGGVFPYLEDGGSRLIVSGSGPCGGGTIKRMVDVRREDGRWELGTGVRLLRCVRGV